MTDDRLYRPATQRNREPILEALRGVLPESGTVLEIASGSGEHAVFFAGHFGDLSWQPSDPDEAARKSIAAWTQSESVANVLPPLDLDVLREDWPVEAADAILCVNMIHISPWAATEGLMRGAGRVLGPGAPLILYGPFKRGDRPLEPGNAAFDERLREEDPEWGLRELDDVAACAGANGFDLEEVVEMPANNLTVIFRKR
jgi:SAM-dependent methyltransferase